MHQFFFSLLLIFLPTQLGLHFWPDWATVLGRRVDYLSPTVFFTDLLVILVLLSWSLEYVVNRAGGNPKSQISNLKQFSKFKSQNLVIFTTISVFILLNLLVAENKPVALYKWLKVGEMALLGWYIIQTKPPLSRIAYPLSLGILYSSLIATAQFFLQHSIGGSLWWLGERTFTVDTAGIARFVSCQLSAAGCQLFLRPYATFSHPNVLGGYLAATLPLMLNELIRPIRPMLPINGKMLKFFKWTTIGLGIIALVLTFSRSAWIAGILGLSITCYVLWRKQKIFLPFMFAAISLILLTTTTFRVNDESFVVRQQLNTAAINQWKTSPLFGVGLANFLVELPTALPEKTVYFLQPVHNVYLLVLAEAGIVGLVFFLWLLWKAATKVFRGQNFVLRFKKNSFIIYHLSFIILLLLGLVDHYPVTLQQGQLLLTVLLALSLAQQKIS